MKAITLLLLLCVGCSSAPTRDDATATGARRGAAAEQPAEGVEATPDAETVVPIEEAEVEFASLGDTLRGDEGDGSGPGRHRQPDQPLGRLGVVRRRVECRQVWVAQDLHFVSWQL